MFLFNVAAWSGLPAYAWLSSAFAASQGLKTLATFFVLEGPIETVYNDSTLHQVCKGKTETDRQELERREGAKERETAVVVCAIRLTAALYVHERSVVKCDVQAKMRGLNDPSWRRKRVGL